MEREQEERGKIEGMTRTEGISLQAAGTETSNTMTISMAEETGNASSAGNNSACSNRGSRENRGNNGASLTEDRDCSKKPLCHGCR